MSRFLVRRCCFVWLALLAAVPGCGGDGRQAVSGTVRFRGQPLAVGGIEFSPEDNQPTLEAAAVRNGEFSIPRAKGLLPGRYKVRINAPDVAGRPEPTGPADDVGPPPKELIPDTYNAKSTLSVVVEAGKPNVFPFDLK